MPPLSQFSPRPVLNLLASTRNTQFLRIPDRPSICVLCKIRSQVRQYAVEARPPKPSQNPEPPLASPLSDDVAQDLPSAEDGRRSAVTKRFSHLMDHLQGNIFIASKRINDLTGYSGIEALKSRIATLESRAQSSQEAVRTARVAYKTTVADRASTQREVTTLLARKDSWTPTDLERFTSLYRMDHSNEQAVQEATTRLGETEREAEHAASKLSSSILSRYHEEQIWSDKIRRMSTWGTWGLMGVNVLLFLVFQFGFEPWRRRRLVQGFEEKVREALEQENIARAARHDSKADELLLDGIVAAGLQELEAEVDTEGRDSSPTVDAVVACIQQEGEQGEEAALDTAEVHIPAFHPKRPETWTAAAKDLLSERRISVRKQDVTLAALEGAATGAAIVTIVATLILRNS